MITFRSGAYVVSSIVSAGAVTTVTDRTPDGGSTPTTPPTNAYVRVLDR
ncbi:hypothetical protein [Brevibacterium yomogidense]|nr:hypothetical protein [Brevibacterium yomogidense]